MKTYPGLSVAPDSSCSDGQRLRPRPMRFRCTPRAHRRHPHIRWRLRFPPAKKRHSSTPAPGDRPGRNRGISSAGPTASGRPGHGRNSRPFPSHLLYYPTNPALSKGYANSSTNFFALRAYLDNPLASAGGGGFVRRRAASTNQQGRLLRPPCLLCPPCLRPPRLASGRRGVIRIGPKPKGSARGSPMGTRSVLWSRQNHNMTPCCRIGFLSTG